MHGTARLDLNDLGSLIQWLFGQWWVYAILGAILLVVIVIWLLPASKVKPSEAFSTDDREANEIALGFLQITNLPSGPWNDPTASALTDVEKKHLVDQWGLHSREDWLANIERLTTDRRRRDVWVTCLAIRDETAQRLGRVPKSREWTAAIVEAGGDKRDARTFVAAIEQIEQQVRKLVGKDIVTPEVFVRTLDGYALGQAVALTTWGVALGFADVAEAREIIHRINVAGRPAFSSWADFGLSYITGRVMHWSDGKLGEKTFEKLGDGWPDFRAAGTAKRNGPWATLPWRIG
ncbi:DUF1266 domain-containing protein [Microbacterium resistens]|uniref:DUF1266 domain-containing protein n=1 Tax=Microbacterium resistens TaxID=156977 RepID=UPI001C5A27DD|nr:DUF1266 domain-containing protein [Microbacterium resistens]MBW1640833.1 DUF1266 domain-containing protein [Microbacterium resistens]